MKSTGYLYDIGLQLRQCAHAWEGEARLLGNIKAVDLAAMAGDYVRLRLSAGISEAGPSEISHSNANFVPVSPRELAEGRIASMSNEFNVSTEGCSKRENIKQRRRDELIEELIQYGEQAKERNTALLDELERVKLIISDVLTPGKLKPLYSGAVACHRCGWYGCYSKVGGCEPIGDTGDYGEPLCPECYACIGNMEEENVPSLLTAILSRFQARLDGTPWPALPCDTCKVLVTNETGVMSPDTIFCKPCETKYYDDMEQFYKQTEPGNG